MDNERKPSGEFWLVILLVSMLMLIAIELNNPNNDRLVPHPNRSWFHPND